MNKLIVEFEKQRVVKSFMDTFDGYYTNLGGYHYSKDRSPCYYLNGMLTMFEEQQKKIDLLETELTETQTFLNKQNRIKQIKIDEITKQRDSFIKAHHISMNDVCEHKAKIDDLQKLRSLDEMAINQLAQANQVWRTKCDELQERIEEVLIEMKNQLGAEDYYGMERPNYDAMLYALRNIKDILKGNKDEN